MSTSDSMQSLQNAMDGKVEADAKRPPKKGTVDPKYKDWVLLRFKGVNPFGEAINEFTSKEEALAVLKILDDIENRIGEDYSYRIFNVHDYR